MNNPKMPQVFLNELEHEQELEHTEAMEILRDKNHEGDERELVMEECGDQIRGMTEPPEMDCE